MTTGLNFTCEVEDCMGSERIWLSLWLEQSEATRLQVATRSQMIQMQCQISATPTESSQSSQELAVSVGTGPGVRASARCMSGCSPDMYQTTWCDSLCRCHCEATRILLHTTSSIAMDSTKVLHLPSKDANLASQVFSYIQTK